MGFDWKAFGAAFLDKQTEGIRKRRKDAEDFEEEQEELASTNKKIIANRTLLAADAAQMAEKARELGATKEQVMAAMSSGALGIKTFYEKLLAAANQKGMQTLGAADVEAIIDMPEVFEVNPAFVDMSLNEMAQIQYGVKQRPGTETADVQTSDSILASMFGVNAMSQAKKKLQDTKYIGGMSIADVNELAAQSDYDSLFPNLGVNFFDKEFYGPSSASEFLKTLTDIQMDAVSGTAAEEFINDAGNRHLRKTSTSSPDYDEEYAARNEGVTQMDKEQDAREYLIQTQARSIIQGTIDNFGQTGLFDHQPSVDLIEKIMGEQFVKDQLELLKSFNGVDEEDTQLTDREENLGSAEAIRTGMDEAEARTQAGVIEQEDTQTQTPDTETQETTLPPEETDDEFVPKPRPEGKSIFGVSTDALNAATRAWDRKYEGKLDPVTGEKIMVDPRPDAGGPKDKEVDARTSTGIRTGKKKKVTAREAWDILYGETHNPDGSPKL
jgi:hypothetical protein